MSLSIVKGDITQLEVDAIVNSTNRRMIGYSGVDELIHNIGGFEFEEECQALSGKLYPGEAVFTNAYHMDCKYIIHTCTRGWIDGSFGEVAILKSCYRSSLEVASSLGCKRVAFSLMCAGSNGMPLPTALKIAVTSIHEYLLLYSDDMEVTLVLHGDTAMDLSAKMFGDLNSYMKANLKATTEDADLETILNSPGKDFVTMLYDFMDDRGVANASQIYQKAGMSKSAYSKLISGGTKKPSLVTAVGLAMALELSFDEMTEFLASAGIALRSSSKYDLIISYFFKTGNHNIWELNVVLADNKFGNSLIGAEE